jgi:hypothetical protein
MYDFTCIFFFNTTVSRAFFHIQKRKNNPRTIIDIEYMENKVSLFMWSMLCSVYQRGPIIYGLICTFSNIKNLFVLFLLLKNI